MATLVTDGSRADVASKIASSSSGDIITLPASGVTWTSGVTISGKAITIRGAGGGRVEGSSSTSLTMATGSKSFTVASGSTINGFTVGEAINARLKYTSSNYMTGTVSSWNGTTLVISVSSITGSGTFACWVFEMPALTTITHNAGASDLFTISESTANPVVIDNIQFTGSAGTGHAIIINGTTSGKPVQVSNCRFSVIDTMIRVTLNRAIIYKCYFDVGFNWFNGTNNLNNNNGIHVENQVGTSTAWTTADKMGTNDTDGAGNVYIEQCYFHGLITGIVDFHNSARGVLRYCIFDNSGITTHGPDTAAEGVRHTQVYNCLGIFDDVSTNTANINYWIEWRGGSGIWTDNTMPNITSSNWGDKAEISLEVQALRRSTGTDPAYTCWAGPASGHTGVYPVTHQTGQGHNGSTAIVEGVYVWNNTGSNTPTPANYPIDECSGGPDISGYLQINRDYFTTAKSGYTKYTYPHPLRVDAGGSPSTFTSSFSGNLTLSGKITLS